ncbi:PilZ domain-containing protein [Rhizobium sp. MHM7A]|nr:PilZ domain-containing protein [Rhizobium sp. MHM7A]
MQASSQVAIPKGEHRRAVRINSRVLVTVELQGRRVEGKILDISKTGLRLEVREIFIPPVGATLIIRCAQIGAIEGSVRWIKNGKIGVSFGLNSNSVAKVMSYFRQVHPEIFNKL